jgi:hypothetical protein
MNHWIGPHRSDLHFKISLLVLGFIAAGALMTFYGYSIAR